MKQNFESSPYKIDLDTFSGPMDLLLYLIRRDEVEIIDVPISRIADQYLQFIEMMEQVDLSMVGDFLIMAATLMEIKSRLLLPRDEQELTGEDDNEDPRTELIRRLMEYKRFKDASRFLQTRAQQRAKMFCRPEEVVKIPKEWLEEDLLQGDPLEGVEKIDLLNAFTKVIRRIRPIVQARVTNEEIPLREFFRRIVRSLQAKSPCQLPELFDSPVDRGEIMGTLLALLELVRLKQVKIVQTDNFGPVWVELRTDTSMSDEELLELSELFERTIEDDALPEDEPEAGEVDRPEPVVDAEADTNTDTEPVEVDIETLRSRHVDDPIAEVKETMTPLPGFLPSETTRLDPGPILNTGDSERVSELEEDFNEFEETDEIDRALAKVIIPDLEEENVFNYRVEMVEEAEPDAPDEGQASPPPQG
tara:strand:- start:35 stop:1291 length:1257 start_codon:yes stop_codon:yes gene_type:complete